MSSNGQESFSKIVYIQTSLNPYVPDFVLLMAVIFLLVILVFVAVPLFGKWVNSEQK